MYQGHGHWYCALSKNQNNLPDTFSADQQKRLQDLGLGELTVNNWEDYENLAVSLAGDRDLLEILHTNLRSMMAKSPLMDAKLYVRSIEEKYLEIWERFLQENT